MRSLVGQTVKNSRQGSMKVYAKFSIDNTSRFGRDITTNKLPFPLHRAWFSIIVHVAFAIIHRGGCTLTLLYSKKLSKLK